MAVKVKGDKTRIPSAAELASAVATERLICADVGDNNNKFWHGYALANGDGFCEWGRVGKTNQHEYYAFGDTYEAKAWLDRKCNDKMSYTDKAPYTRQRTIATGGKVASSTSGGGTVRSHELKTIATQQIQGDAEVRKLAAWLAEVNIHQITKNTQITYNVQTGSFSTPLGLVTPDGITEARDILGDIATFVAARNWTNPRYQKLLTDYLRIVPQDLGMTRGWHETIFAPSDALQKQNDILDSLSASLIAPTPAGKVASATEQVFNVKLETVTDSNILTTIRKKYNSEKGGHSDVRGYDVEAAWTVHISTVRSAFQSHGLKVGNIMQLWHGTKASNLLSILKSGLMLSPPSTVQIAGKMFGNGLYFSDQSTKSIRYATGAWTSGGNIERTFMFIADVAMGKHYTPDSYKSSSFKPPAGYDSTFAKGGISAVANNEMIVYKTSQADLTYLVEFKNKSRW